MIEPLQIGKIMKLEIIETEIAIVKILQIKYWKNDYEN